jgi:hypothetical protein
MKKLIVLFLFVLFFGPAAFAAEKPLGAEEFTSVEELALALSSYFPKVQGEVKTVQGDRLTLALGRNEGLIPGMVLTLWRDGKEVIHPVTKAVIGRVEDEVGTVEVVTVNDSSSTAAMKKKLKEAKPGDRARITPRKINAALVPLRPDNAEIIRTLAERLNEFGRLNVLEPAKVDVFLQNSKAREQALVRELGSAFGLDAVVSVGIYPSEGRLMVTARIFYTEDVSQLDTIVAMLNLKSKSTAFGEVKPYFTPVKEEKTTTSELPFTAQFFLADDFEPDGKQEYVFSDSGVLHIYRNEPSGWREVWTETIPADKGALATLEWRGSMAVPKEGTGIQHINIDSADFNGNGRPEIFVTAVVNGSVVSYVIEFGDGSYRRTSDIPGFVRVVTFPSKGTVLLGQGFDPVTFYAGNPKEYVLSDGKYTPGPEVSLPSGLGLYGWIFARLDERQPLLVALDDDDRLQVYAGETLLWKSAEQYTAVDKFVYRPVAGIEGILNKTAPTDKGQRLRLRGRVLAVDTNNDGRDEILLPKNVGTAFIGGFTGAELHGLEWTGSRLNPVWSIKEIPGPVYDFRLAQHDQPGTTVSALVRTKGGLFTKDRQQLILYSVR